METFNENIINMSELNINEYFEIFYSTFYVNLDKKFQKFLLNANYKNTDFYIDINTLKEFNIIISTKPSDVMKVIKMANLRINTDYITKQKQITTNATSIKSGIFYNEFNYKFTLNAFKFCFMLEKNNIREWLCYEECNRYYIKYLQLYSNTFMRIPRDILNSNKILESRVLDLKENIDILHNSIETLNDRVEILKEEFKDNMNCNIIDIKNNIKNIVDFNNLQKNMKIKCPNYDKVNNLYKYKMFCLNLVFLYSLRSFINYIIS